MRRLESDLDFVYSFLFHRESNPLPLTHCVTLNESETSPILLHIMCNKKWLECLISELISNSVFYQFHHYLPANAFEYFFLDATNKANLISLAWFVATTEEQMKEE